MEIIRNSSGVFPSWFETCPVSIVLRRAMLFRQRDFDCVRTVIFDEVHYLGDEERGSAWEEAMILLPAHINLVCLSATVPNCLDLAGWICQTRHSVCHLLLKQARPTPLRTYGFSKETRLLLDDNNVFLNENMEALVPLSDRGQCDNFQDVATNTKLTPTLAFMFSKVHCQTHALALSKRLNQADVVSRLISEFASTDATSKRTILFWSRRKIQRLCPVARLLDLESQQRVEELIKRTGTFTTRRSCFGASHNACARAAPLWYSLSP